MGVVYRARQEALKRTVALKMIRHGHSAGDLDLTRFRNEAEVVARLHHPHVVPIFDFGEWNQLPYFTMELMAGGTLSQKLAVAPLPALEAAGLVETLARTMQFVHQHQVVHRDLKPANVLLTADGVPKIADFGLAKFLDRDRGLTFTGAVLGTASYMAPEQAAGQTSQTCPATDVYALGAILYEALTGRPPFRGETRDLTIYQVLHDEPVPPAQIQPAVPADLQTICLKCLEKDPAQRYASAEALAEDLRCFQLGEPIASPSSGEWDWRIRCARRAGYEIIELIGCGRFFGLVYKARQLSLNRVVTLKMSLAQIRPGSEQLAGFRREAETLASLQHPNIVQVFAFGEQYGQPYIAMEYVDGGTLAERLLDTPLPARRAAELVVPLARAMHFAHQKGIVHGALRPFNVLLTADGVPKITNFGLGEILEGDSSAAANKRALLYRLTSYLAPEQTEGRAAEVGPPTDVYALGAMLYELLTGRTPCGAETVSEFLEQVRALEPPPPSHWQPGLPRSLDAVCLRCLQKCPGQRYASAEALAEDLQRFLTSNQTRTDEFELIPGYEMLEELGRGGLGIVHKARQVNLDRLVALKVFNANLSRASLNRIRSANRAMARLQHPNILQVYDSGERDGLLYIAEELVEGVSLDKQSAGLPQPPREAARLLETLARAIHHAHEHNIVHRNLKPRVVLLTPLGIPKISSFELAKLLDETPPETAEEEGYVGTPTYMAPEQAAGRVAEIGPPTDVYALGNILYQLLTGQPPFRPGDNLVELLSQLRSQQPVAPSLLQPHVPPALEAICLKCLHKKPAQRYQSALDLAEDLGRFLAGVTRAQRGGFWRRLANWIKGPAQGHG
jgi:serine/threonine protein kinase